MMIYSVYFCFKKARRFYFPVICIMYIVGICLEYLTIEIFSNLDLIGFNDWNLYVNIYYVLVYFYNLFYGFSPSCKGYIW